VFKNYYLERIFFDEKYNKIKKTPCHISDDDNFNNGKIFKILKYFK
jgi:hypothetical protein